MALTVAINMLAINHSWIISNEHIHRIQIDNNKLKIMNLLVIKNSVKPILSAHGMDDEESI